MVHLDYLPGTFFGPSTLVEMVRHRARTQPKDIAFSYLVDGELEQVDLTYEELDRQARAIGAWLMSRGLAGERALLLYPAGLEFIAGFLGCLYAGVVAVPVYPPRRNRSMTRIQSIADDAEAKVALTTNIVLSRVESLIDETSHLKELAWLDTCHVPAGIEQQWQLPDIHGETLAFLQYTSGSTGTPKGVILNHANLVHNSALIAHAFEHTRTSLGVFWLPSYHDMGLIGGILQPIYLGRTTVLMSPMTFLQKPFRWLSAITRFHATTAGGPNFAYEHCIQKITPEQRKQLDLSSWKLAFNGAEPVRAETLRRFAEIFAPCGFRAEAFYPCFGLAEATLIVSGGYVVKPPIIRSFDSVALTHGKVLEVAGGSPTARDLVGCGGTLPDQKIVIANPETKITCSASEIGEIWVSGPSMAQGYWKRPDVTEATFHAHLQDTGDGPFLRTGDLGFMLDGELYVTGRLKDLIILRGVNYYPQDIELTVQRCHPRLRTDCGAAFAVEKDGREQLVLVFEVERHKQGQFGEVLQAIRRSVAGEHDLNVDVIVLIRAGTIPKTSSGKIQRHACRQGYLDGTLDVVGQWLLSGNEEPNLPSPSGRGAGGEGTEEPHEPVAYGLEITNGHAHTAGTAVEPTALAVPKPGQKMNTAQIVIEEIRRVAKERANGMTLDSMIAESGMDSLERMEILSTLEERFGGRFPPQILTELETTRQVITAVETYLDTEPRTTASRPAEEISPETYNFDQFPEYKQLRQRLDMLETSGLGNPYFGVQQGITNDRTVIDGSELINFASYNYVGTSGDPIVSAAAKAAIDRYGTSVSASRLASGEKVIHGELESAIARFIGTEAAVTFVGGHATNESVIGHLVGPGDLILQDSLAHNSIVEGAILSGARRRPFTHNDWRVADQLLEQFRHEYRRVLLVIEGVYSMDGDFPDLPRFIEVKKRHKALLMIDEAHSIGVLGHHGRGIGEHFNVRRSDVDIWMGTMSKALGSCGGYIAGSKALIEYLKYTAPGFVFSVGLPASGAGAALASIRIMETQPERVVKLRENATLFLTLAKRWGMNTGTSQNTGVVPVIVGNSIASLQLSRAMFARGVNVQPIIHPAVDESAARLRFFITSLHTSEQIRYTVDVLAEELEKMQLHGSISGDDTTIPDGKGVPGNNEPRNSKSLSSSSPVKR
ncbi:MAG: aminotransferase class I/II-fold pyridoxal phosphate-dependent enzyme [Planctomycetota bacterium]